MRDSGPWIALLLGIVAIALVVLGPDTIVDTVYVRLNIPTPQATPTLSAGNAAAEATRVAQEQYAILTAEAAQSERVATTQAGIVQGTRQAAEANQARLAQEVAEQTEGTAWAVQVTTEHERFVATATSAAEATRAQVTVVARMATRQAEEDSMTATVESRMAVATQGAIEREEREKIRKYNSQARKEWGINALFVALIVTLVLITSLPLYLIALLLRQCLRCTERCMGQWPSTLRALLFIWNKYARREKCKKKTTPP